MKRRREREIPEYAGAVRRMIRSHGRKVGDADPEDLVDLVALRDVVDAAIADAVQGQRDAGFSWAQIGRGLGMTRQAAQQRFGERRPVLTVLPGQVDLWS
jgi:hypothetical protein